MILCWIAITRASRFEVLPAPLSPKGGNLLANSNEADGAEERVNLLELPMLGESAYLVEEERVFRPFSCHSVGN